MQKETKVQVLGETENYAIWVSEEPEDGQAIYHIELNNITLHLFPDEWEEFAETMMQAMR